MADATATPIPDVEKLLPLTMIMAEATDASAISGATAAPMLAQPRAIICSEPPSTIPAVK